MGNIISFITKEIEKMTVQECYENIGANYEEILGRIGKPERVEKYLKLFLKDDSYAGLCRAMEEKNYQQAFACVHNLKGVALNLSLGPIAVEASELCEALRGGEPKGDVDAMFARVQKLYKIVTENISQL